MTDTLIALGSRWHCWGSERRCSAFLLYSRMILTVRNPQLWAEDGAVFRQQACNFDWDAFLIPYVGYLHLVARLSAWGATVLPVEAAPAAYVAVSGVFLVAVVAAAGRSGSDAERSLAVYRGSLPNGSRAGLRHF